LININTQELKVLAEIYPPTISPKAIQRKRILSIRGQPKSQTLDMFGLQRAEKENMKPPPEISDNDVLRKFGSKKTLSTSEFDTRIIRNASKLYGSALAKHIDVDNEYLSLCPQLYQNVERIKRLELTCIRGPFCTSPGVVTFSYPVRFHQIS
jgi:hypothetical protein